ncbi:unnamed protein product [Prorocentrum cordatum]|uniref:EF-hand domain-containing protein n=1 Tax=Prorocentrum cordatum TaxID=2364126 RepID=A0ABN9XLX8_9DINO|nr:unnamed protein product [Polarella glacialis]
MGGTCPVHPGLVVELAIRASRAAEGGASASAEPLSARGSPTLLRSPPAGDAAPVAASPDPVASSDRSSTERLDGAAHAALERALLQGQAPDRGAPPGAGPSRRRNSDEQEENLTKLRTAQEVKDFMNMKEGSTIRAWLRHFDLNNDLKISHNEFVRGLKKLDYHGDPSAVFIALDVDHSQELSLQEIDEAGATVWQNFRAWCVERFSSTEEMLERLRDGPQQSRTLMKRGALTSSSPRASAIQKGKHAPAATLDLVTFTANLKLLGYGQGFENIVFQALVGGGGDGDSAVLGLEHLKWFEIEKRRQRRKEQARKKAALTNALRKSTWKGGRACLNDFKAFLKRTHGNYIRGWRMALSPTDSMVVSKGDVFKACTHMGWQGDVRLLYKTLDKDDSGYVSMEELDPYEAQVLAHFHIFVGETFGNAASAFQAFDKSKLKKLRYREFVTAARSYGFKMPSMKLLFNGLDKRNAKAIVQEDLLFLDKWKCPPFLHVPPNQQAAEEVKMLFLKHYKTFVKAWRMLLDADSSNRCTYSEWEQGCKKIGFQGDTPGAWRALDRNFSGYIPSGPRETASSRRGGGGAESVRQVVRRGVRRSPLRFQRLRRQRRQRGELPRVPPRLPDLRLRQGRAETLPRAGRRAQRDTDGVRGHVPRRLGVPRHRRGTRRAGRA